MANCDVLSLPDVVPGITKPYDTFSQRMDLLSQPSPLPRGKDASINLRRVYVTSLAFHMVIPTVNISVPLPRLCEPCSNVVLE